jgi:hypothetical protein
MSSRSAFRRYLDLASRGSLDETPVIFGSRIKILLDAKAVYGPDNFGQLREKLVGWYRGRATAANEWTHLFNDV